MIVCRRIPVLDSGQRDGILSRAGVCSYFYKLADGVVVRLNENGWTGLPESAARLNPTAISGSDKLYNSDSFSKNAMKNRPTPHRVFIARLPALASAHWYGSPGIEIGRAHV